MFNLAFTQFETGHDTSEAFTTMRTDMNVGIYVPDFGMPTLVEAKPRSDLIKIECLYCRVRHLFDREKESQTLIALQCLACGAPLPWYRE